ncbi:hypothetical protein Glove_117g29 [Diversispora epigaea]|uniref:Uncharacterized protein n=1 Tax=Diversispora epigaea TaxID=1348612 RepID=A0A397J706_9GLOM|nr:hypothetical protein Glove_117g29 [Diversispora epigaea]
MSSHASSPSPTSIMEERPTRKQDLDLKESHFEVFRREEISGRAFLKLIEEKFRSIGFKLGTAAVLTDFIEELTEQKNTKFLVI